VNLLDSGGLFSPNDIHKMTTEFADVSCIFF
jgi:hypothetical protein